MSKKYRVLSGRAIAFMTVCVIIRIAERLLQRAKGSAQQIIKGDYDNERTDADPERNQTRCRL